MTALQIILFIAWLYYLGVVEPEREERKKK